MLLRKDCVSGLAGEIPLPLYLIARHVFFVAFRYEELLKNLVQNMSQAIKFADSYLLLGDVEHPAVDHLQNSLKNPLAAIEEEALAHLAANWVPFLLIIDQYLSNTKFVHAKLRVVQFKHVTRLDFPSTPKCYIHSATGMLHFP